MTADINVILQLLQRQNAAVPPAYSTVSSSTLPTDSAGLYGTGTPVLHSMYPVSPIQMDNRIPKHVSTHTTMDWKRESDLNHTNSKGFSLIYFLPQTLDQTNLKSCKKSQESLSSGIHMTAASNDTTFMAVTPEADTHPGFTPQLPLQSVKSALEVNTRLYEKLHCPSLPADLDLTSERTRIQKHVSDPTLPVTWRPVWLFKVDSERTSVKYLFMSLYRLDNL